MNRRQCCHTVLLWVTRTYDSHTAQIRTVWRIFQCFQIDLIQFFLVYAAVCDWALSWRTIWLHREIGSSTKHYLQFENNVLRTFRAENRILASHSAASSGFHYSTLACFFQTSQNDLFYDLPLRSEELTLPTIVRCSHFALVPGHRKFFLYQSLKKISADFNSTDVCTSCADMMLLFTSHPCSTYIKSPCYLFHIGSVKKKSPVHIWFAVIIYVNMFLF